MVRKKKIHNPYNHAFEVMYDDFPKELHENLKVPGIFVRKSEVRVRLRNGIELEMDASYIVDPDYIEIFERMVVNLEHQSTPVGDEKIEIISKYGIQEIILEKLPHMSVVASHLPKNLSKLRYNISPSDVLEPYYLDLGEEDNRERLINVSEKINNNEKLSTNDALQLGIIVLFAPRDKAMEITEKVVQLYLKIRDKLSDDMEYVLYTVLYSMIDAYFDEENDFVRLTKMIGEKTSDGTVKRFESIERVWNNLNAAQHTIIDLNTQREKDINTINTLQAEKEQDKDTINTLQAEKEQDKDTINTLQAKINNLEKELAKSKGK